MGRRPATIHDANAAKARADAVARLDKFSQSAAISAVLLLLLCVPMLRAQAGVITTAVGYSLNDPSVPGAGFIEPTSVALDSAGNIYTADPYNCVVWKTHYGTSSVFAGILTSTPYSCSSGAATTTATTTPLAYPVAVAQCNGNVFVASLGIDPHAAGGGATEVAGTVNEVDTNGNLSTLPLPLPPSGVGLHPVAIACDASGNVYVSSYYYDAGYNFNSDVDEFSPIAGGGWNTATPVNNALGYAYPAIAVNPANGDLYGILDSGATAGWLGSPHFDTSNIWDITQNSQGLSSNPSFTNASALAIDTNGNFYIAQAAFSQGLSSYVDFVQASTGTTTVIAGTGETGYNGYGIPSTQAEVDGVTGITLDPTNSYIYLADSENELVRRIHSLIAGPSALNLVNASVPQSSSATYGSLQGALNPVNGDFYYVTGPNTLNIINTGASAISPGYERIIASIPVGAAGPAPNGSALTLAVDSTHDLIYASNTYDGKLYVINGATRTVVGSVALDNANASLLAVDSVLNEVYAGGPNATKVSAVRGGTSPALIGNYGYPVNSLSVDSATDVVYAVADSGAGGAEEEALIIMTPDPVTGVLAATITPFPLTEEVLQPAFIANSIAADPLSGGLIASGAASINPGSGQDYDIYDIFQFTPDIITAPVQYTWPPITSSLDIPNRVFYITDFDGLLSDPSSHATMVTGIDGVIPENNTLRSFTIPVFGSGATPSSPHVFDAEPDTGSYQAWISGSDVNGGFVELWDAGSQAVTHSVSIPNNGGGHLFVNSSDQDAYLLDEVNAQLWLIDTPQWTPTPAPTLSQAPGAASVTISAVNSADAVYYTTDGTPPGLGSSVCISPCGVTVYQGEFTTINAIEVATLNGMQIASNVAQGVFTAAAPTSLAIKLSSNPTTGATLTATATITPSGSVSNVTGTVSFTATPSGLSTPVSLCSQVSVANNSGSWQAVCNFVEDYAGSYTIAAAYSGDAMNQPNSNTAQLTVVLGTTPILMTISDPSSAAAINSNNASGFPYNAVLNRDTSVSLIEDGAILSGQGCPAFPGYSSGITSGAIYADYTNSRIYLAILSGTALGAAYESINPTTGACTQGPLLELTANALSNVEMNVDVAQGNVYILNSFGAFPDAFYILPTAPWNPSALPTPTKLTMGYSSQYGPIVIDPSNDMVYVNDLGGAASGTVGTYSTAGFFVYDPKYSGIPANNLLHATSYINGSGMTNPFYVGTLLTNGAGELVLVNNNPYAFEGNLLTAPITVIDTTQPGFSFFNSTSLSAAISTISATSSYTAIGGADIDAANNLAYVFAYNSNSLTTPGSLLEYNLVSGASPQEIVLSPSAAMPSLGYSTPWSQMNYNPESTELALSAVAYSSGALGFTSPLCAGTPLSLAQVAGSAANPVAIGNPVVNTSSGYVYAIQSGGIDYVAPPPGCNASPTYTVGGSVTGLASGTSVTLLDNGGDSVTVIYPATTFTFPTALANGAGYLVTVGTQPVGETCNVTSGSGTIASANISNVSIACTVNPTYTVGGSVTGLASGTSVTLLDNGGDSVTVTYPATTFTFPTALASGSGYLVTVGTQPVGETCNVTSGSGMIASANISNVSITCTGSVSTPAQVTDNETITVTDTETFPDVVDAETIKVTDTDTVWAYNAITITPSPASFNTSSGTGYATHAYAPVTFTATGGIGTLTLTESGALPTGITFSSATCGTGVLCGTPTTSSAVPFTFSITATDADGDSVTVPGYSLIILAASAYPAQVTDNETITVTDTETFPDVADSEPITVTDSETVRAYSAITISPTPATFNASDGSAIAAAPYGPVAFTATGGTGTLSLTESGTLPAGLTFTNGSLGGTLSSNSAGAYTFSVKAADIYGDQTIVQGYTLNVAALPPSLTVSASPITLTIVQGRTGQTTLTFTPQGGYSATLQLGCLGLPANTQCVFELNGAPPPITTVTVGNNQPVNVVLTIETDVDAMAAVQPESAPTPLRPGAILTAIAFWSPFSLLGVIALRRKRKLFTKNPRSFRLCLFVLLIGALAGLAGCISGGGFGAYVTPVGTSTVTVVVTPGSGSAQTLNIGVTITQQ